MQVCIFNLTEVSFCIFTLFSTHHIHIVDPVWWILAAHLEQFGASITDVMRYLYFWNPFGESCSPFEVICCFHKRMPRDIYLFGPRLENPGAHLGVITQNIDKICLPDLITDHR